MASAMKFCYYSRRSPQISRTLSNSSSGSDHLEDFKRRFRRSGSLGIPFIPEEELSSIKELVPSPLSIREQEEEDAVLTVIIRSARTPDGLSKIMAVVPEAIDIRHIESRDDSGGSATPFMDVLVELHLHDHMTADELLTLLRCKGLQIEEVGTATIPRTVSDAEKFADPGLKDAITGSQWFPKHISELDICAKKVVMYGSGLDADHPGFKDDEYRKRRMMFAEIAINYKQGTPIPRVEYTQREQQTWSVIYRKLRGLHKQHACREYLENFELLERHCGYSENSIPQLEDISRFLKAKSGFSLRPVAGYLSARDFLAALAFRVFNCTQYIRHHANPFYTPEPDTVHELMGHVALLADPEFAQFSQEIGLASLGASEEDLSKLATLYFFTIEFGLSTGEVSESDASMESQEEAAVSIVIPRKPKYKIYGAGLLSSADELQYAVSDKAEVRVFDPEVVVQQECLITTYQTAYFYTRSFEEAMQKLQTFTSNVKRPFVVRYNAYTQCVDVLNNKRSVMLAVNSLRSDVNLLTAALRYII